MQRDPDASNRSPYSTEPARRPDAQKDPAELERDIANTRAEMGETLDAIERKLSPERIRHEVEDTVHGAIDRVQERFSPDRIKHAITESARETGRSMLDTIKENPMPSLVAGLSIGWLIAQGSRSSRDRYPYDRSSRYRRQSFERRRMDRYGAADVYGPDYYEEDFYYEPGYPDAYEADYFEAGPSYTRDEIYEPGYRTGASYAAGEYDGADDGESMSDQARHKAEDMKHRAEEKGSEMQDRVRQTGQQVRHRTQQMAHQAENRMRSMGRRIERQAHRAEHGLEQAIRENPLAVGAIAAGVGALIGSLLPSTPQEDRMMGPARDRVVDKAEHAAERTFERAEQGARKRFVEEAQHAAERTFDRADATVRHAAEEIADEMKGDSDASTNESRRVEREAKEGSRDVGQTSKNQPSSKT